MQRKSFKLNDKTQIVSNWEENSDSNDGGHGFEDLKNHMNRFKFNKEITLMAHSWLKIVHMTLLEKHYENNQIESN